MHENQKQVLPAWKMSLGESFLNSGSLLDFLKLNISEAPRPVLKKPEFSCLVTKSFARRMKKGDWNDPLLLQVLPLKKETLTIPEFEKDAVGDNAATVFPGLIHKYENRALFIPHSGCALHCRYCFRRAFPYDSIPQTDQGWKKVCAWLETHEEIHEVILSGGDPLMLDTDHLENLLLKIAGISQVNTIRIHTRMPVACPCRIDPAFVSMITRLMQSRVKLIMVIQVNHPEELRGDCLRAIKDIHATGILLFNQSVMLKNINDNPGTQRKLANRLIQNSVIPYYLHQLDRTEGTGHFEVGEQEGKKIWIRMRETLPGYALPRYVKEIPGGKAKMSVNELSGLHWN